jgi:hypothetical protein
MKKSSSIEQSLGTILNQYKQSFTAKIYREENDDIDLLMEVFGITPEMKRENRQYWGRELGMCWQRLVTEICRQSCKEFGEAVRFGADEPYDLTVGNQAIDTKYRVGSGDSGTLKKFKGYATLLREKGYDPVLLIAREDNLPAAITACRSGGWLVITGSEAFQFLKELTGFDLKNYLQTKALAYKVQR